MRWQRGPFESGDFGENGSNGEQSPNYMKEDHRSNGRNCQIVNDILEKMAKAF